MRAVFALVAASFVALSAAQAPQAPQGTSAPGVPAGAPPPAPVAARGNTAAPTGTRTATIRGRVTAADTGLPIRQAQIRITGFTPVPGVPPPLQATDAQGRFEFTAMPAGRVTITASKAGYVTLSQGQRTPREPARLVDVGDGAVVGGIDFVLPKGGRVVARVTDDLGGPIAGMALRVEEYRFNAAQGGRALLSRGTAQTDDRGEGLFVDLAAGDYYVSATPGGLGAINPAMAVNDSGRRYGQPTYHPGVIDVSQAQRVTVRAGQTATVAFPLVVVRAVRVAGALKTIGIPPQDLSINVPSVNGVAGIGIPPITPRADGSFEMLNAMPGRYTLSARPRSGRGAQPADVGEYGTAVVVVADSDVTDVLIATRKASTIRGHYVFDAGLAPPTARPEFVALLMTAEFSAGTYALKDNWTFEMSNVAGAATFRLRPAGSTPTGWYLKSVRLGSKDVTDTPSDFSSAIDFKDLEVVVTQTRTDLTGSVTDARNVPQTGSVVVVFPEDRSLWTTQSRFIAVGRPDPQGQFRILALPPGRYFAAAVEYLETGEERDTELLARLETGAQRLTLGEGESKSINLKVTTY